MAKQFIETKISWLRVDDKETTIKAQIYLTEGPFDNPPDKRFPEKFITQYYKRTPIEKVKETDKDLSALKVTLNQKMTTAATAKTVAAKDAKLDF